MARDDFDQKTKDLLAKRAGFRCSNPACDRPTVGAATDPAKSASIGVAAHITAAAAGPGAARYDPNLTHEERASALNGIWLCAACGTLIDRDEAGFPVELLNKWKSDRELATKLDLASRDVKPPSDAHTADYYAARAKQIREEPFRDLESRLRKSLDELKAELRECLLAALDTARASVSRYPYPETDQFGHKLDKWAIPEVVVQSVGDRLAPWLGDNAHRAQFRLASTAPVGALVEDRAKHYERLRESIGAYKSTFKSMWSMRARRLVSNAVVRGLYDEVNRLKPTVDERRELEELWKVRFTQVESSMEAEVETMIESVVGQEPRHFP